MKAGDLRNRVTIQAKSVTRDSYGAEVITWTTHATVWAAIEPLRGREWLETRQVQADVDTRIRIRYLTTVTPSMRVLFGSRVFEIIAPPIHVQERKRETHLMCRENPDSNANGSEDTYTPALQFNEAQNSMYLVVIGV